MRTLILVCVMALPAVVAGQTTAELRAQMLGVIPAADHSFWAMGTLAPEAPPHALVAQSPSVYRRASDAPRSIPLAFGLSALVPGAGQAYNRSWTKAAVALGLEAVVFAVYSSTRSRGLDAEDDFRSFAHRSWDPAQYGRWLNDYVAFLEQDHGLTPSAQPAMIPSAIDFTNPAGWSAQERAAVAAYFKQIQAIERTVFHPETGATFSHQLPGFGEQQYYELIGKYFQFAPGWEDYPEWKEADGVFTSAIDPEMTGSGGSKPNVSATFYRYAGEHAHAQDLLRTASRLSTLFVVNHLLAGIDAAVTAKLRNDRISTRMEMTHVAGSRPEPSVSLALRF